MKKHSGQKKKKTFNPIKTAEWFFWSILFIIRIYCCSLFVHWHTFRMCFMEKFRWILSIYWFWTFLRISDGMHSLKIFKYRCFPQNCVNNSETTVIFLYVLLYSNESILFFMILLSTIEIDSAFLLYFIYYYFVYTRNNSRTMM